MFGCWYVSWKFDMSKYEEKSEEPDLERKLRSIGRNLRSYWEKGAQPGAHNRNHLWNSSVGRIMRWAERPLRSPSVSGTQARVIGV